MKLTFREITPENFKESIDLKVAEGQEKFVAPNVYSIAQSKIYPAHLPFALYADDGMVDFVLYGFDEEEKIFIPDA